MRPMTTKFGSLVGIGVAHDLTFSVFGSMASEPIGSDQSKHCSFFQRGNGYFSYHEKQFPVF